MEMFVKILFGMTVECLIAATLAAMGWINLTAFQQAVTTGIFLIFNFIWLLFTRELNEFLLGMAIHPFATSVLSEAGIINLNPLQQFICGGLYGLVIVGIQLRGIIN